MRSLTQVHFNALSLLAFDLSRRRADSEANIQKNDRIYLTSRPEINDNVNKYLGNVVHTRLEINFQANSESRLKPTATPRNDR